MKNKLYKYKTQICAKLETWYWDKALRPLLQHGNNLQKYLRLMLHFTNKTGKMKVPKILQSKNVQNTFCEWLKFLASTVSGVKVLYCISTISEVGAPNWCADLQFDRMLVLYKPQGSYVFFLVNVLFSWRLFYFILFCFSVYLIFCNTYSCVQNLPHRFLSENKASSASCNTSLLVSFLFSETV